MSEDLIKIRNQIMALAEEYFILKEKDKIFIENISSIPVSGKVLDNKDLINLIQSSLDMWLTAGEFTEKFLSKDSYEKFNISPFSPLKTVPTGSD